MPPGKAGRPAAPGLSGGMRGRTYPVLFEQPAAAVTAAMRPTIWRWPCPAVRTSTTGCCRCASPAPTEKFYGGAGIMHHFFAYILRMRYIDRWPDAQQLHREHPGAQPPGGHSGHALAVLRNEYFGGQVDTGAVAVAACITTPARSSPATCPRPSSIITPTSGTPISRWRPSPAASSQGCCRRSSGTCTRTC